MSRNVLRETGPHTYLDDLESFFFVLCWILVAYQRPGIIRVEMPDTISLWDDPGSYLYKIGLLASEFKLPVSPWFGQSLRALLVRLHGFFNKREALLGRPPSDPDPVRDYDEFLSHIEQSITDLEQESVGALMPDTHAPIPDGAEVLVSLKRSYEPFNHGDEDEDLSLTPSRRQPPPARPVKSQPLRKRPRRSTANYGNPTRG